MLGYFVALKRVDNDTVKHSIASAKPGHPVGDIAGDVLIKAKISLGDINRGRVYIDDRYGAVRPCKHGGERPPATSDHENAHRLRLDHQIEHCMDIRRIADAAAICLALAPSVLKVEERTIRPGSRDNDRSCNRVDHFKNNHWIGAIPAVIPRAADSLMYHNFKVRRPILENGELKRPASQADLHRAYHMDYQLLKDCDAVFAVPLGRDPGTLVEIGMAIALGKPVITFDPRAENNNTMVVVGSSVYSADLDECLNGTFNTLAKLRAESK